MTTTKSGLKINIRQEHTADRAEVNKLVNTAFSAIGEDGDDTEEYLVKLREKPAFIPELALVAENTGGGIVGQIVLYNTVITTPKRKLTELLLSPICVHPDYFCRGIARCMTERALSLAKTMGYGAVFLCGDPDFYSKLDFRPSCEYGIFHVRDASKSAGWSMVRELFAGALSGISGMIDTV